MNLIEITITDIIIILFRLINFIVIVMILGYFFNRSVLPSLAQTYQDYYGYLKSLLVGHDQLGMQATLLRQQLTDDQQEQNRLKDRLMAWNRALEEARHREKKEEEDHLAKVQDRLKKQYNAIKEHRLYHALLPAALHDARARLEKQAAAPAFQKAMIEKSKTLLRKASFL